MMSRIGLLFCVCVLQMSATAPCGSECKHGANPQHLNLLSVAVSGRKTRCAATVQSVWRNEKRGNARRHSIRAWYSPSPLSRNQMHRLKAMRNDLMAAALFAVVGMMLWFMPW